MHDSVIKECDRISNGLLFIFVDQPLLIRPECASVGICVSGVCFPHSLVFLFGFAEEFQDVDRPGLCQPVCPVTLCPLRRLSLGVAHLLFHDSAAQQKWDKLTGGVC